MTDQGNRVSIPVTVYRESRVNLGVFINEDDFRRPRFVIRYGDDGDAFYLDGLALRDLGNRIAYLFEYDAKQ